MSKAAKKIAVYRIVNTVSGSYYIGSSTNLYERWRTHRTKLRAGTHPNPQLQASWRKHGESAFFFVIIAEFEGIQDMELCEESLLVAAISDPLCCNLSVSATTPWRNKGALHPNFGKTHSDDVKEALRAATTRQWIETDPRTGRKHTAATKQVISGKVRAALAEGRGGKFIPSEETKSKMSSSLKGNRCALGYKRTDAEKAGIAARMRGKKNWLGKTHSDASRNKMGRAVVATDSNGVETIYITIAKLRQSLGLTSPTVNRALKAGRPLVKGTHRGWSFRYADPTKFTED